MYSVEIFLKNDFLQESIIIVLEFTGNKVLTIKFYICFTNNDFLSLSTADCKSFHFLLALMLPGGNLNYLSMGEGCRSLRT